LNTVIASSSARRRPSRIVGSRAAPVLGLCIGDDYETGRPSVKVRLRCTPQLFFHRSRQSSLESSPESPSESALCLSEYISMFV
jgi:hypothetical protein